MAPWKQVIDTIPYPVPGVYAIEVTASGLQGLKWAGIELEAGQRLNLPLQLIVGQATTEKSRSRENRRSSTRPTRRGREPADRREGEPGLYLTDFSKTKQSNFRLNVGPVFRFGGR